MANYNNIEANTLTLVRYILDEDADPNVFSYELVRVRNSIQAILDQDKECSCKDVNSRCKKHKDMLKTYQFDKPRKRPVKLTQAQHKQKPNV
jgi:hypothetical protein